MLLPCPFCGGKETQIRPNRYWTGMRSQVISVEIRHWCDEPQKGVGGSAITMRAKTEDEAVAKWNERAGLGEVHLSSGGKPDTPIYTRRDVAALVEIALAAKATRTAVLNGAGK